MFLSRLITNGRIPSSAHPGKRYASQDGQNENKSAEQHELNRRGVDSPYQSEKTDATRNYAPEQIGTSLGDAVRVNLRRAAGNGTASKNRQKNQSFHNDSPSEKSGFSPGRSLVRLPFLL